MGATLQCNTLSKTLQITLSNWTSVCYSVLQIIQLFTMANQSPFSTRVLPFNVALQCRCIYVYVYIVSACVCVCMCVCVCLLL